MTAARLLLESRRGMVQTDLRDGKESLRMTEAVWNEKLNEDKAEAAGGRGDWADREDVDSLLERTQQFRG